MDDAGVFLSCDPRKRRRGEGESRPRLSLWRRIMAAMASVWGRSSGRCPSLRMRATVNSTPTCGCSIWGREPEKNQFGKKSNWGPSPTHPPLLARASFGQTSPANRGGGQTAWEGAPTSLVLCFLLLSVLTITIAVLFSKVWCGHLGWAARPQPSGTIYPMTKWERSREG